VPVRIDGDILAFAAPDRMRSGPVDPEEVATVVDILGVDEEHVVDAEWLDNGPGWVGILLDSAESVLRLKPDASSHPGQWNIGVIGPMPDGEEASFELRAFFGEGTLREDPVTGSLNASAAQWLLDTGRASAPYIARQGTALGRRGRVHVTADAQGIWVGGVTHIAVTGTIDL
jgi:PhzF family phenazine biosynthesis protein